MGCWGNSKPGAAFSTGRWKSLPRWRQPAGATPRTPEPRGGTGGQAGGARGRRRGRAPGGGGAGGSGAVEGGSAVAERGANMKASVPFYRGGGGPGRHREGEAAGPPPPLALP